jgi:hypothetical protein
MPGKDSLDPSAAYWTLSQKLEYLSPECLKFPYESWKSISMTLRGDFVDEQDALVLK